MSTNCMLQGGLSVENVFWGNCVYHCQQTSQGSLGNRVVHSIIAASEALPIIGQIVTLVEILIVGCRSSDAIRSLAPDRITILAPQSISIEMMEKFWREQISSFKIAHGTNGLYLNHFRRYGISSTYPAAIREMVNKIRNVWARHQHDISPKTNYFHLFEQRYDQASQANQVAFSFSAKKSTTTEFTVGARHGGEWIRELRRFVNKAGEKAHLLSADEKRVIIETRAFIRVLDSLPALVVKVSAGCPDLIKQRNFMLYPPLFSTLEGFIDYVKNHCAEWPDPDQLVKYFEQTLLPQLKEQQQELSEEYEIMINGEIGPEHLEFELVGQSQSPDSKDYPHLAFDQPVTLSLEKVAALRIYQSGFSQREAYADSRFICDCNEEGGIIVTRKKLTEQDRSDFALQNEMRQMCKAWLHTFNCDLVSQSEF